MEMVIANFKGGYTRDYIKIILGAIKGDTRKVDHSSYVDYYWHPARQKGDSRISGSLNLIAHEPKHPSLDSPQL